MTHVAPVLRILAAVALLIAAGSVRLRGQPGVQTPGALKRMTVAELLAQRVISVTRTPDAMFTTAGNVTMIGSNSARITGAATLPELLRLAPNLFVAQGTAYDWAVGARGFVRSNTRVNKLLVQIDGRTVYSPVFSGVFWDSQDVFMPDLERVEVFSGPAGVTWGANAVNGVINILSRSARDTTGGVAYAGLGNESRLQLGVRQGGRLGEDTWYRVYAKRMQMDTTLAGTSRRRAEDAWDFDQAGFRIDSGDAAYRGAWTLQGDVYRGDYDSPGSLAGRNEGGNLLARWSRSFSDQSQLDLRVYHDYVMRHLESTVTEHLRTTDLEVQHRIAFTPRHRLEWGAGYRYIDESMRSDSPGFSFVPEHVDLRLASLFLQDEYAILPDRLRLISGIRLEDNSYSGLEAQPGLRLVWSVHPHHTVWSAASRATRTPSRIDADLFVPNQPPFLVAGGPDFTSETVYAYEIGWRGRLAAGLSASATAYVHEYHRLRTVEAGAPMVIANGADGRSSGVELFVDWEVMPRWRMRLGYFGLHDETTIRQGGADIEGGLGEASHPDYQVLLRNTFDITPNLSLWLGARSVGRVPAHANGVDVGAVPAYTELDANLSWTIRPGIEWSVTGRNLLHDSHPEIGAPATRREIQRSVRTMIRLDF